MKALLASIAAWAVSLLQYCPQNEPRERYQKPPPVNAADLAPRIEEILREHNVPGATVVIANRDGIVWEAGVGAANLERRISMSPHTPVYLGSISKIFVSLATMKLVSEGRLDLQTPVATLAPELPIDNPYEATRPLRLVNLLENTTGWQWCLFDSWAGAVHEFEYTLERWMLEIKGSRRSQWPPGDRVVYSNLGPATAAYIVQKTVGERFEDYARRELFEPLGIEEADYNRPRARYEERALPYRRDGQTPYVYDGRGPQSTLVMSAHEMARALRLLLGRGRIGDRQVLPERAIVEMETPVSYIGARSGLTLGYAKTNPSWMDGKGFVWHGHGASVPGMLSFVAYRPESNVGFFFSINKNSPPAKNAIEDLLYAFALQNETKPTLPVAASIDPTSVERFSGWYRDDSPLLHDTYAAERLSRLIHLSFDEQGLRLKRLLGPEYRYAAVDASRFRLIEEPLPTLALVENDNGRLFQRGNQSYVTSVKVPTALVWSELGLATLVIVTLASTVVSGIVALLRTLVRRRRPPHATLRGLTFVAATSLVIYVLAWLDAAKESVMVLGGPTPTAIGITLVRTAFIFSAIAASVTAWRSRHQDRSLAFWHGALSAAALTLAALYFLYWDPLGYPGFATSRWWR